MSDSISANQNGSPGIRELQIDFSDVRHIYVKRKYWEILLVFVLCSDSVWRFDHSFTASDSSASSVSSVYSFSMTDIGFVSYDKAEECGKNFARAWFDEKKRENSEANKTYLKWFENQSKVGRKK